MNDASTLPSDQTSQKAADFLKRITSRSRTAEVLDALVDMIDSANLKIGDRIPAETVLCEQLGVGRSTIREALNRWEGLGLVKRRRGSGTFLTANIRPARGLIPTTTKLEGEGLLRLVDVRRTLEIELVQRAAKNATDTQKQQIKACYARMKKLVNAGLNWRRADKDFHNAIYDASGNPIFGQVIVELDEAFHAAKFSNSPFDKPEFGHRSVLSHAVLCDAIIDNDPAAARDAICHIIDQVIAEIREVSGAE